MDRITTSIKVNLETWKTAKKKAIDLGLTAGEYLERLIKNDTGVKENGQEQEQKQDN